MQFDIILSRLEGMKMKRLLLAFLLCVMTFTGVLANKSSNKNKSFFMITSSVTKNHLRFKQTSDNTWQMYVPATYPCPNAGNNAYTGFQFIVGDEEGYLYTPQSKGQIVNGEEGTNSGTLTKSQEKRSEWWNWYNANAYLEVKKDVPQSEQKNPYNGMTAKDLVMDGCLVFTITLDAEGNLKYKATLDPKRRVSYAACNTVEGSDNGTYYSAAYTTFLFADKQSDGTFSPYYKGKVVVDNIPSENYNQIKHNGFYFYTPIDEEYEAHSAADNDNWWKQVKNNLVARGISPNGEDLFQNGGNFESLIYGSFNISTTFYYGGNNQGRMEKTLAEAYDDPLVGSIRTYCNEGKNMESRYNVRVFLVTGYDENNDAFLVSEIPYIPKGVGVLLYTTDATVDVLAPEKEWKGQIKENIESSYGNNYLVPTFTDTDVSTYSTDKDGNKYENFFLAKLHSAREYREDKHGKENYWGFFSVLNTQKSKANRAYLHYPVRVSFDGFSKFPHKKENGSNGAKLAIGLFGDENTATGIKTVSRKQDRKVDDAYYTLDGRKVEKPAHGLFIHNGKTYLFQ